MRERLREVTKFVLTGGICFLVDYAVMVALKELLGVPVLIATAVGFSVSVGLNYILCVVWVFQGAEKDNKKTMLAFLATSLIGLLLNELFMWLFVHVLLIHYMVAKIISAFLVMVWNYLTKRLAIKKAA